MSKRNGPPGWWYEIMDKFYFEKNFEDYSELEYLLGKRYKSFLKWAYHQYVECGEKDMYYLSALYLSKIIKKKESQERRYEITQLEWAQLREKTFKRDDYTCVYCGKRGEKLELDHIIPFSRGGRSIESNVITSCRLCNRQKKDKTPIEFIKWKLIQLNKRS